MFEIDEGLCCAHGDCAEIAPAAFAVDDVARAIGTAPTDVLRSAAEACPLGAITVIDPVSGERLND